MAFSGIIIAGIIAVVVAAVIGLGILLLVNRNK